MDADDCYIETRLLITVFVGRPTRSQIQRHNLYLIRRLQYEEIARDDPVQALRYLQTRLSESIDHSDPVQLREFHQLTALLFRSQHETAACGDGGQPGKAEASDVLLLLNKSDNSSSSGFRQATDSERSTSVSPMLAQMRMPTAHSDLMSTSTDDASMSSASTVSSDSGGVSVDPVTSETRQHQALALADRFSGHNVQKQRALLYNRLVSMLPAELVQPTAWLSDVYQNVSGVYM